MISDEDSPKSKDQLVIPVQGTADPLLQAHFLDEDNGDQEVFRNEDTHDLPSTTMTSETRNGIYEV